MSRFEHVIYPNNGRSRGFNRYRLEHDRLELDIMTNNDGMFTVICDKGTFKTLSNYYWCISLTGRQGYTEPTVTCYINKRHNSIKNILFPQYKGKRIEHLNGNSLDFRDCNLKVVNKVSNKTEPRKDKKTAIMRGIQAISNKLANGTEVITGYSVGSYRSSYYKYFGIKKYGNIDNCLAEAVKYRNELIMEEV